MKSNGGPGPERHKIRAPSYVNVPTFRASCIGQQIADVTITLAAIDPCYSCTERMVVVRDADSGEELTDFAGLVKLSQQKTERIRKEVG
ncbi:MAG: NADH-quinone oxidoreductase subunit D-related protein [Planctomycetota bacterium]